MSNESNEEPKSKVVAREERILSYWNSKDIFKKSLEKESPKGEFVFYDGPPFATGLPHYGHLVPGTIKDIIPRYKTMQGYHVTRRWGWDTQGVPIEAIVQKENNLKTKQDIEAFGIATFNEFARSTIFRYADDWKKIIPRTGRWVDFDDLYTTMAPTYTESIWWMWKTLHEKGLVYEGFKSMHVSPPLETALSNFEVNQGYKDVTDISVIVKFELLTQPGTFVLAWTTTPWTLPGNAALAVHKATTYVRVYFEDAIYIVAKDLVEKVFADKTYEIKEEVLGASLVGEPYKPVFTYYASDETLTNHENGWRIYDADFVTTENGTGVVHIAPAFGEDDLIFGQTHNIPFIQHVYINGIIKDEVADFAGLEVKPKDNPTATDIEVIKNLAHRGLLFSKEKYTHSYPHCYRTDAPLLNYAMSSWFIKVTAMKDLLLSENAKVSWTPDSIGKNRFGNWLKDAKDWAVSRARYWGTPIPVWKSNDEKEVVVIGSLDELRAKTKSSNRYFVMRHGEAESNVQGFVSSDNTVPSDVTESGKEKVLKTAQYLKNQNIDLIIVSPLNRTIQTAQLLAEELRLSDDAIIVDNRLTEIQAGDFNGKTNEAYGNQFSSLKERMVKPSAGGGECIMDLRKRCGDCIYDLDSTYAGKNILIVTHDYCVWMLDAIAQGLDIDATVARKQIGVSFIEPGNVLVYDFAPIPHNESYELDFHRPYIDDITFMQNGKRMYRIPEVFDTWIDSGSVPFASNHYPFSTERCNPKPGWFKKSKGYPADFIAEGLDQTRGWFYSMLVLNTALFGKAPYKQVVVNGLLLAEDGLKMSKRLKNYPEMDYILEKYGADALRYFLMASPLVRAEEAAFSEKGVDEVMKKLLGRLDNIVTFYELYADKNVISNSKSTHVLDVWIVSRLSQLRNEVTEQLDVYAIDKAARPLMDFVDDFSTWYIRRSRDRFKEGGEDAAQALETTKFVLETLAKLLAPFIPFIAEDIYQRIHGNMESVHLETWPHHIDCNTTILEQMEAARALVTKVLDLRTSAGIKVRQPLQAVTIKNHSMLDTPEIIEIIKDEVNVKEVVYSAEIEHDVALDTNITEALQREGDVRELIRCIQTLRKQANFNPEDTIVMDISENARPLVTMFLTEIEKATKVINVVYGDTVGETVKVSFGEVSISVHK